MELAISNLVDRFERGALSRRQLIRGLTMLAAAGAGGTAEAARQDPGFKAVKIDHVSIQVNDLPRSIEFYRRMFGLTVVSEDKANEIVRMCQALPLVSLHHKSATAIVDHFAIGVDPFDKQSIAEELKRRGASPEENIDAGFHVKDPDRIAVQVMQI